MKKLNTIPKEVEIIGQIADLKEIDYRNMLVITALVELFIEKGIITRHEILQKTRFLDSEALFSDLI